MKVNEIIRERVERAGEHLQEVFSDFLIVGLPIDTKEPPMISSNGDKQVVLDLVKILKESQ